MSWKDRLMMKMLGNKVVIKIFSIPIVLKSMMWLTQVLVSAVSVFKKKNESAA